MRGTWQTTGSGGGGGLVLAVVVVVAVVVVAEAILSIIIWLAVALGVILALAAAGLIWWLLGAPKRKAIYAATYAAAFEAHRRPATVTATVIPQAPAPSQQPEIHNHGPQFHFYGVASPEAARVIRTALPGRARDDAS